MLPSYKIMLSYAIYSNSNLHKILVNILEVFTAIELSKAERGHLIFKLHVRYLLSALEIGIDSKIGLRDIFKTLSLCKKISLQKCYKTLYNFFKYNYFYKILKNVKSLIKLRRALVEFQYSPMLLAHVYNKEITRCI